MKIRAYEPADLATVEQWAKARNMALVPQLLSPNGFLVEDDEGPLLVAFGYLIFDCPIVQIDHLLGRPGASIGPIRDAWGMIQRAIVGWIQGVNEQGGFSYRLIRGFVAPVTAKESEKMGWHVDASPLSCIRYVIP
jgi:hypothetical protein